MREIGSGMENGTLESQNPHRSSPVKITGEASEQNRGGTVDICAAKGSSTLTLLRQLEEGIILRCCSIRCRAVPCGGGREPALSHAKGTGGRFLGARDEIGT